MTSKQNKNQEWKQKHGGLMTDFLSYLNSKSDRFILKGGTSLALFYGLDRFSEDLDFDGVTNKAKIKPFIADFVKGKEIKVREAKNTHYGERFILHYDKVFQLKIETSTRLETVDPALFSNQNGVLVYILSLW